MLVLSGLGMPSGLGNIPLMLDNYESAHSQMDLSHQSLGTFMILSVHALVTAYLSSLHVLSSNSIESTAGNQDIWEIE